MLAKKELWDRLRNHSFDNLVPPSLLHKVAEAFGGETASLQAFAQKIARKQGWKTSFAVRAIQEYRKFIYLGITAPFRVTPSQYIDKVWHEHLLFTKAYRQFCDEVIEHEFDHFPELIPEEDHTSLFQTQYQQTLQWYESEFGYPPPQRIWGQPKFKPSPATGASSTTGSSGDDSASSFENNTPLHAYYALELATDAKSFPEFNGGDFGGGGAGDSWADVGSSDNAGGDSSCSSCSSSCGGGD